MEVISSKINVEDIIDINNYYILQLREGLTIPLRFMSIKRNGPDYWADVEKWKDKTNKIHLIYRTDSHRTLGECPV